MYTMLKKLKKLFFFRKIEKCIDSYFYFFIFDVGRIIWPLGSSCLTTYYLAIAKIFKSSTLPKTSPYF